MKKQNNLDTSCKIILKDGTEKIFNSIEEASENTGMSVASIKIRCNKTFSKPPKDGIICQWLNEHTQRVYRSHKSRHKGHGWELEVIKDLTDLGFEGLVSSRSESRKLDDAKIDIADTQNVMDCYIQCKATDNTPNIEKIIKECSRKDRPLVVAWKKQNANTQNHRYAIMPIEYFYQLLRYYIDVKMKNTK